MKRNSIFCLYFAVLISFFSCSSIKSPESVYVPVDYTEDDAVREQLEAIEKLSEKDSVRAIWRSKLVMDKVSNDTSKDVFDRCCQTAVKELNEHLDKDEYFAALRIARSLAAVSYDGTGMKLSEKQIEAIAYKNVPGNKKASGQKESVATLISGTVTVYVDKGIKIQRGVGYADSVLGSGFFISKDGYIITNHHVISDMVDKKYEGYSRLYVKLADDPDTRIPAKVVGYDSTLDLALLKCEIEAPYVFVLGSSSDLSVGDKVYAIGSPLGLEKTLTSGIISSTDRQLFAAGTVFQIDAAVNSGNSGGPLVDEMGRVQAVVFAGVQHYQGLNFAIPVEYLKNELPFLYAGGERKHPWIAAYGKTKRRPGVGSKKEGVNVYYCLPGGSANLSGIQEDDVVVGINGMSVDSLDELHLALMKLESGIVTKALVQSPDGKKSEKIIYLESRPAAPGFQVYRHDSLGNAFYPMVGMKLINVSAMNKKQYMITKVIKGSSAEETGFSENDPVEIYDVEFTDDKSAAIITLAAKKRKNGFLDVSIKFSAPMDSTYYF
ncbi:MAG: serine protease [Treponema sp.]|nr:serine protease [Candidatus Treponema equi]